jgi:tripartite-type tricarboxylate transporter receptor subunit TctC
MRAALRSKRQAPARANGETPVLHLFRIANSLLVVVALLMGAGAASAQDYPNRPITIIVPFTPGATTDAVARLTRDVLERELGAPIVIDNRAGAAGTISATAVANAKP